MEAWGRGFEEASENTGFLTHAPSRLRFPVFFLVHVKRKCKARRETEFDPPDKGGSEGPPCLSPFAGGLKKFGFFALNRNMSVLFFLIVKD